MRKRCSRIGVALGWDVTGMHQRGSRCLLDVMAVKVATISPIADDWRMGVRVQMSSLNDAEEIQFIIGEG